MREKEKEATMRLCCPGSEVDWSQSGGLCCCNWPWCDSPNGVKNLRIAHSSATSLTVEIEQNASLSPMFVFCILCIIPPIPLIISREPANHQTAWSFTLNDGKLMMTRRHKTACEETQTVESTCVLMTSVQIVEDYDNKRNMTITKRRLMIVTNDSGALYSPWKEDTNHFDIVANRINALIPEQYRTISAVQGEVMQRDVVAMPVDYTATLAPPAATANRRVVHPIEAEYTPSDVPLARLVDIIKHELAMQDSEGKLTVAQILQQAGQQLGLTSTGVLKTDAIEIVKQLGVSLEQYK